jgi:hypothetical protein
MTEEGAITRRVGWRRGDPVSAMLSREWLVTNGLGGYASGTVSGVSTRRFHGVLIAALPAPLGLPRAGRPRRDTAPDLRRALSVARRSRPSARRRTA